MTNRDLKEVARRMRGLKKDVERLKGQREAEGETNILRSASDELTLDDSATLSVTEGGSFQTDSSDTDGSDLIG